jgi:hypothetical protein
MLRCLCPSASCYVAASLRLLTRVVQIARKALHRWANQKLTAAFNTWYVWLLNMISQRQVALQIVCVIACEWVSAQATMRAVLRWRNRRRKYAFRKWLIITRRPHVCCSLGHKWRVLMKLEASFRPWRRSFLAKKRVFQSRLRLSAQAS